MPCGHFAAVQQIGLDFDCAVHILRSAPVRLLSDAKPTQSRSPPMTASTPTLEDFQKFSKDQLEAFTAASTTLSKGLQDIAAESGDYSKKAFAAGTAMYEKLLGARSIETAIQIQTEFAKQAYEGFVAQATKVSELYTRVASDAMKPVTTAYANVQK